jgi:hypothetical protein
MVSAISAPRSPKSDGRTSPETAAMQSTTMGLSRPENDSVIAVSATAP